MAGIGRKFKFHGSFTTRAAANKKHKKVTDSWVRRKRTKLGIRYIVMTEK